jgi:tRNA dimethylallyltransferase
MASLKKIIIVSGPTATGKSSLSIEIAKRYSQCEVVNFDSLCFYEELSIGTAKPTHEELNSVPHHLFNISSINDDLNASDYCKIAQEKINELHHSSKIPILVGGSGFYLRALIKGMYDDNEESKHREEVELLYEEKGIDVILDYLKKNDPESLEHLHKNDHYRLCRAMEFHLNTRLKISDQKKSFDESRPYDFKTNLHNWDIHHIYLDIEKEEHWKIIENRTKKMIKDGLLDEVHELLAQDYSEKLKPLQCIGYKQVLNFLHEKNSSKDQLIESIYIATRRLAKSQRTFFKKVTPKYSYHPLNDSKKIFSDLNQFLE